MALNLSTLSSTGLEGTPQGLGARYTLMSDWEAAAQLAYGDLVARGDTAELQCYNDWPSGLNNSTTVSGWNTDAVSNITIRAADGEGCNGVEDAGFRMSRGGASIVVGQQYTVLENIQLVTTGSSQAVSLQAASTLNRCICISKSVSHYAVSALGEEGKKVIFNNCLIKSDYRGVNGTNSTAFLRDFNNCTILGTSGSSTLGIVYAQNAEITNCVVFGFTDSDILNTPLSLSYTAISDASEGTNGVDGVIHNITDAAFTNYIDGDYTPAIGGVLAGSGIDLSGTFTDDITGATRTPPWDIGAYKVAGGVAPSISFDGPSVTTINGTQGTALASPTPDPAMNTRFTVAGGTASYALQSGTLPAGVTIDPTTGNLVGAPSEAGTFAGIVVRGTV